MSWIAGTRTFCDVSTRIQAPCDPRISVHRADPGPPLTFAQKPSFGLADHFLLGIRAGPSGTINPANGLFAFALHDVAAGRPMTVQPLGRPNDQVEL